MNHDGWTVVDALIAVSLTSLLATAIHSVTVVSVHALRARQVADDLDESARIALEIVARDVRDVGYGLLTAQDRGLRHASKTLIRLARDLDLDGRTNSSNERVAYMLDAENQQLRRQLGRSSPQPLLDSVATAESSFRFFDDDGFRIGGDPLDSDQRARVHRVDVFLRLTAPHPAPGVHDAIETTQRTSITLRNAQL